MGNARRLFRPGQFNGAKFLLSIFNWSAEDSSDYLGSDMCARAEF